MTVGKRTIELSNLAKVLYPADSILKAEVIQYYLQIAPTLLRHVRGRPLSLVRWPDGVGGESFFQKNTPDWAPEWLKHTKLGGDGIDYVLATEDATLVWLANLACLEIHQMHCREPKFENPDYMVFDLDPPEEYDFPGVVETALDLRESLERFGYHAFVKTTGGKGLHVVVPLEPRYTFDQVFETARLIATPFVASHSRTTLQIKKEQRKGRILIDIYRIRPAQTIVSAYSLRGRDGAPVSMPLPWSEIEQMRSPLDWNIHSALERVQAEGDAWQAIEAHAVPLHTEKPAAHAAKSGGNGKEKVVKARKALEDYAAKRSFQKTPEPGPAVPVDADSAGSAFVVHRHHASRLHYDLRLEKDGTLKCWAVPKGLPPRPGIKRLAVQTEDHPLKYLDFHGTIAKGQYGAGDMWIYARGRYTIFKDKKDGFYFRLASPEISAEYRMIHTRDKDWLLERLDQDQKDWLAGTEFMLAVPVDQVPDDERFIFEVKWDGIRALILLDEGNIRILSRNQRDITDRFPELMVPESLRASSGVFDGEIVCLDGDGRPEFQSVIRRLQQSTESGIARVKAKHPAVCYLFDCLYLDGRSVTAETLERRREWLKDAVITGGSYRFSQTVEEGHALFDAARAMGLEGIMAKDRTSRYLPGRRSPAWLKVKVRSTVQVVILGFTAGEGARGHGFGAMHVGQFDSAGQIVYRGRVGTGFDDAVIMSLGKELRALTQIRKPLWKHSNLDDDNSSWVEPELVCDVRYASLTADQMFREPVFVRMRPDLTAKDCTV